MLIYWHWKLENSEIIAGLYTEVLTKNLRYSSKSNWFNVFVFLQEALQKVRILPESARSSLLAMLDRRTYWCISRQRSWGVPIPAFYHKETGEALINKWADATWSQTHSYSGFGSYIWPLSPRVSQVLGRSCSSALQRKRQRLLVGASLRDAAAPRGAQEGERMFLNILKVTLGPEKDLWLGLFLRVKQVQRATTFEEKMSWTSGSTAERHGRLFLKVGHPVTVWR